MIFSLIQLLTLVKLWFRLFVKSHFESLFFLLLCFSFVYFHFKYVWKEHWIFRLQYSVCNQRVRHWSQNHWLEFRPWTKYEWMLFRKVTGTPALRPICKEMRRKKEWSISDWKFILSQVWFFDTGVYMTLQSVKDICLIIYWDCWRLLENTYWFHFF